jgi:hypothetical protein
MLRSPHPRTTLIASVVGCLALAGTVFAQTQSATPAEPPKPSYSNPPTQMPSANSPTQMPAAIPNKSETASSAFEKLDASHAGFVSKDQVAKLDGFSTAFVQADKDKDGKLTRDEFQAAWAIYSRP